MEGKSWEDPMSPALNPNLCGDPNAAPRCQDPSGQRMQAVCHGEWAVSAARREKRGRAHGGPCLKTCSRM